VTRLLRSVIMIGLAACLMGADGCNGIANVSVANGHLAAASPAAKQSTFENPVLATRDNPGWWGPLILPAGVSSSAADSYSADGQWTNLTGAMILSEYRRPTSLYGVQWLPLLPAVGSYEGPGMAYWSTRGGTLVHGNTYRAELSLDAHVGNGHHIESGRQLFAKLSDEVALVPVVLISWKLPGNDPTFQDQTLPGHSLFDFIPPLGVPITPPDLYEEPPDNLWDQCGVQFQVVASFVFELPAGFNPGLHCGVQVATFAGQNEIESRVRNAMAWHPSLGDRIVEDLLPVYVSYGELGSCAGFGGYVGKWIPNTNVIEVDFQRTGVITGHELGHVLLGDDHSPLASNLMTDYPGQNDRELTAAQCDSAHATASNFSERFARFNVRTGRVAGEVSVDLIGGVIDDLPFDNGDDISDTGPVAAQLRCCEIQTTGDTYQAYTCGIGAVVVPDSMCEVCCYDEQPHEVSMTLESQCPAADVRPDAQCDEICCSTWGDTTPASRFACSDAGGYEIPCGVPDLT
jgi:hypothetical protein